MFGALPHRLLVFSHARATDRPHGMTPDGDGVERLERRVDTLMERYDRIAEQLHRLDERGNSAEDERREMRQALKEAMAGVRTQIKEEITTQIALQMAAAAKEREAETNKRRWSPKETAALYAATILSAGGLLTSVIK